MNKKRTISMWILYAVQAIPALIWIFSGLDVFSSWLTFKPLNSLDMFYEKIGFHGSTELYTARMILCGIAMMIIMTVIIITGAKSKIFSKSSAMFMLSPYIVWLSVFAVLQIFLSVFIIVAEETVDIIYPFVMFFDLILLVITQIYLIIKLAKSSSN